MSTSNPNQPAKYHFHIDDFRGIEFIKDSTMQIFSNDFFLVNYFRFPNLNTLNTVSSKQYSREFNEKNCMLLCYFLIGFTMLFKKAIN